VAQVYNPSYSGGRDQEDLCSKSTPSKQFVRTYFRKYRSPKKKKKKKKKGLAEWLKV
jgi:penicillin V acylase-like amidase (Ntn superfamily)